MEEVVKFPWVGVLVSVSAAACMAFLWLLLRGIWRKEDDLNFRYGFIDLQRRVTDDPVNEANFEDIEMSFNSLPRKTSDQKRAIQNLWTMFLTRFQQFHSYPLEEFDNRTEGILKKRLETTLSELDTEINALQEKENSLVKSRKKSTELVEIHEESQRLLQKYEMLANILDISASGSQAKGKNKVAKSVSNLRRAAV